jgi:hypothetical protein
MAHITALNSFPDFQDYKEQGKLAYASAVRDWLTSLITFQTEANAQRDEVNALKDETSDIRDEAVSLKNNYFEPIIQIHDETLSYRNDAVNAKETIQNYVIPNEATYSIEQIDALIEETEDSIFLDFKF